MATVQLLPPNAPAWIVNQWQTLNSALSNPSLAAATRTQITQQMNNLAATARQLQQVAQQPSFTQATSQALNQIGIQLRSWLQAAMPYLRTALQTAGAPLFAIGRYVALAQGFLVSDAAAAMAFGFIVMTAKVLLIVLAIILLLCLLAWLYKMLNDMCNAIQQHNRRLWTQTAITPANEAKAEAARRIEAREIEKYQAAYRDIAKSQGGILMAIENAAAAPA